MILKISTRQKKIVNKAAERYSIQLGWRLGPPGFDLIEIYEYPRFSELDGFCKYVGEQVAPQIEFDYSAATNQIKIERAQFLDKYGDVFDKLISNI